MKIISVPGINGLCKTIGCDKAFEVILDELRNLHSTEEGKSFDSKNLEKDSVLIGHDDIEEDTKLIYEKAFENFKEKVLFVGGDHSISYPLTRAFFDNCENSGKEPCLIVFDAHPDCMEPMQEPTHEEWLRKLVEDGFPPKNILLVGVRNIWQSEFEFLKEKGIRVMNLNRFLGNIEEACDSVMEFSIGKELYVSIDVDVVDPAFAPGTHHKEVGGLSSRQIIYLVQRMKKMKNLRAVDLVEINPEKDSNNLTSKLAARIIAELI